MEIILLVVAGYIAIHMACARLKDNNTWHKPFGESPVRIAGKKGR